MRVARERRVIATAAMVVPTAVACIACGTGLFAPPATATYTYDTAVSFQFENSDSALTQDAALSVLGEMTLTFNYDNGEFHGTYAYNGYPGSDGTLAGTINPDSSISVTQYGDPSAVLGATLEFLHNQWPNCDFTRAQPVPFSGSISSGAYISGVSGLQVPCSYSVNQQQIELPTHMIEAIAASPATGTGAARRADGRGRSPRLGFNNR